MGGIAIGELSFFKKFSRIAIQFSPTKTEDIRAGHHTINRMLYHGSPTSARTVPGKPERIVVNSEAERLAGRDNRHSAHQGFPAFVWDNE
jgi:hypothetical protein